MSDSRNPLMTRVQPIAPNSLRLLHPSEVSEAGDVRALLDRVWHEGVELWRGMNRRIVPETARIDNISDDSILLRTENFEPVVGSQILLNFALDDRPYFLSARLIEESEGQIRIEIPAAIHRAERRSRRRIEVQPGQVLRAAIDAVGTEPAIAEITDWSAEGIGLKVQQDLAPPVGTRVRVNPLDHDRLEEQLHGEVRTRTPEPVNGWVRIGLDASSTPLGTPVRVERAEDLQRTALRERALKRLQFVAAGAQFASSRLLRSLGRRKRELPPIEVIDYENEQGEKIRAIVNSSGSVEGAPVVVMPPAWGRTKETLMPLAESIVSAFEKANEPIVVVRFDGIRKRGESFNDPNCTAPGKDHHRFTFYQGVRDIRATIDFLERSRRFQSRRFLLVSFSASAIEARRAVATDDRICGWVSVVGAPDLQSMMRVISGGVDYAVGLERGVRFGLQEILGVEVDMDHAGLDSFEHQMTFLEDARRDMGQIEVPVTWIRGRYDAWMDADRTRDILSRGNSDNRRFIDVPTGHMLKTSSEALDTFQLVVREASRMILGREITPTIPNLASMEARRRAERARLPKESGDIRSFWRDYLVGRDSILGIELMTSITPYDDLMRAQVAGLDLREGDRVIDIGAGTGSLPLYLSRMGSPAELKIWEVDYVREGLERGRERLAALDSASNPSVSFLEADLSVVQNAVSLPFATEAADSILAALFLSYVRDPDAVLAEMFRSLKPGGRVVVSSLRPDADMSKLYMDGIEELRSGRARERFGIESENFIDSAARGYLNQASRLLDLEEKGVFTFFEAAILERMVRRAGFRRVRSEPSLGSPPQAVVVSAVRP